MCQINKPFYLKCFWGFPLGVIIALFQVVRLPNDIGDIYFGLFGGVAAGELPDTISIMLYVCPLLVQLFLFANIISEEKDRAAVYLFTRSYSRVVWFRQKLFLAFICSILFSLFMYTGVFILSYIMGIKLICYDKFIGIIILLLLTAGLNHAVFVIGVNMLSIRIRHTFAFIVAWLIHTPGQLIATLVPKTASDIVMFYPSAQSIIVLHDLPNLAQLYPEFFIGSIKGFTLLFSTVYNVGLIAGVVCLGIFLIRRTDLSLY